MEQQNYDFDVKCNQNHNENITESTEQGLKESIENILVDGFNVENEQSYNSLNKLLKKYNIVSLCGYQEIIEGYKIGERTDKYEFSLSYNKEDGLVYVYPASNAGFSSQCGYIKEERYYESINIFNIDISNNNISTLPIGNCSEESESENIQNNQIDSQIIELSQENEELRETQQNLLHQVERNRLEIEDLRNQLDQRNCDNDVLTGDNLGNIDIEDDIQINQNDSDSDIQINQNDSDSDDHMENNSDSENEVENNSEKVYIVQSGDTLWQIVKHQYGLTSNRDIANCVNKLVKYNIEHNTDNRNISEDNTPDGIFGDKIYVGQKIILAKELTFRKQIFQLNNQET